MVALLKEDQTSTNVLDGYRPEGLNSVMRTVGCLTREYYICPKCDKSVLNLYHVNLLWGCSVCHKLHCATARQGVSRRLMTYGKRGRKALGASENLLGPFPVMGDMNPFKYAELHLKSRRMKAVSSRLLLKEY